MIKFSNVDKWYGEYHALVDINAEVRKGEVVVVCGPSGSGKSTLIRTVNRLEEINRGKISFDGQDIHDRKMSVNAYRSRIGFVFQQFNLFPHLSVHEAVSGSCSSNSISSRICRYWRTSRSRRFASAA